jgi:ERCC4-type nuclease
MDTHLIVDYREDKLIQEFKDKTKHSTSNLDIGDIWITKKDPSGNDIPLIIFERKEIQDLASSITSGRYHEQKKRLIHTTNSDTLIVYIIEGSLPYEEKKIRNLPAAPVYSCIWSTAFHPRTRVMQTKNVYHTARCCESIMKKIKKKGTFWCEGKTLQNEIIKNDYESVLCSKKKKNKTKEGIEKEMLCCITGISYNIAVEIIKEFGSISGIVKSISEGTYNDRIKNVKSGKTKKRAISKKIVGQIQEQFTD